MFYGSTENGTPNCALARNIPPLSSLRHPPPVRRRSSRRAVFGHLMIHILVLRSPHSADYRDHQPWGELGVMRSLM